jgi:uncharacterized protein YcfJ
MKPAIGGFSSVAVAALTMAMVNTGAMAQSAYDDYTCRQYADAQIAPYQAQANSQAVGSALLGAGLGAALGAAVGGGRGAGIGAASGAVVGTMGGAANAQAMSAELQQQYNALYYQCMASRQTPAYAPQPGYGYAQPTYAQPTYAQPTYAQPGYSYPPAGYAQPGYAPYR